MEKSLGSRAVRRSACRWWGISQNLVFAETRTELLQEKAEVLCQEAEHKHEDEEVSVEALEQEVVETALVEEEEVTVLAANSFENLQCGEEVYATLSGGTLTISGKGKMWDYSSYDRSIFYGYRDLIREIVIKDGITSVANYSFAFYMQY